MPDDLLARAAAAGVPPLLLSGSPWAIRQDMLATVMAAARFPERAALALSGGPSREQPTRRVAVVPLTGVITPQGSILAVLFGGTPGGLLGFRAAFDEAMADSSIDAILLDIDSPGGLTAMVPETAAHIRAARGQGKPIVTIADSMMASAAYWIGSQADEIVMTPSGLTGSIGIYLVHEDRSEFNAKVGIVPEEVIAGKYKAEASSTGPLTDDARATMQELCDDLYAMFVNDIGVGRGVPAAQVISDYGEGRILNARRALAAGVVDRVDTYEATIDRMLGAAPVSTTAAEPAALAAAHAERTTSLEAALERANAEIAALKAPPDPDPSVPDWSPEERALRASILISR